MKIDRFARVDIWDQQEPCLALGCKSLRQHAPKLSSSTVMAALDVKSFIKPNQSRPTTTSGPVATSTDHHSKAGASLSEVQAGGTRWNPSQEQIRILEMLYREGMRTPTAQQIDQITAQLGKYGKIEGKNVFYWFQNHKARERRKHKRRSLVRALSTAMEAKEEAGKDDGSYYKRKCRSWAFKSLEEGSREDGSRTLELFPLHPEGR